MPTTRRLSATTVAVAAVLACAFPALAAWNATSSGATAGAKATTVDPVTGVTTSVTSSTVQLSWTAPASGAAPTGYTVTRTAPTSATVCAGSATTTCTDSGLSAGVAYTYSVVAVRHAWTSTAATTIATPGAAANFLVGITGSATAGVPQSVSITARNGTATDTSYTGSHTLTFGGAGTSAHGDVPTASASVVFVNGVGTAAVTFYKAETIAAFTVTEGARTGSTPVTVAAGTGVRLRFTDSSVRAGNSGTTFTATDCLPGGQVDVGNGGIFRSRVSITDLYGNAVTNGIVAVTVTISRSLATTGTLSTGSLGTVPANANPAQTTGTFDYTHPTGNPANNVLTASAAGFTPVSCTIRKP